MVALAPITVNQPIGFVAQTRFRRFAAAFRKDSSGAVLGAHGRSHAPRPTGRLSLRNLPDPESMSAVERCREVASLLARGFLRYRLRRADAEKIPLDVLAEPSHSCLEPQSTGETGRQERHE